MQFAEARRVTRNTVYHVPSRTPRWGQKVVKSSVVDHSQTDRPAMWTTPPSVSTPEKKGKVGDIHLKVERNHLYVSFCQDRVGDLLPSHREIFSNLRLVWICDPRRNSVLERGPGPFYSVRLANLASLPLRTKGEGKNVMRARREDRGEIYMCFFGGRGVVKRASPFRVGGVSLV